MQSRVDIDRRTKVGRRRRRNDRHLLPPPWVVIDVNVDTRGRCKTPPPLDRRRSSSVGWWLDNARGTPFIHDLTTTTTATVSVRASERRVGGVCPNDDDDDDRRRRRWRQQRRSTTVTINDDGDQRCRSTTTRCQEDASERVGISTANRTVVDKTSAQRQPTRRVFKRRVGSRKNLRLVRVGGGVARVFFDALSYRRLV